VEAVHMKVSIHRDHSDRFVGTLEIKRSLEVSQRT